MENCFAILKRTFKEREKNLSGDGSFRDVAENDKQIKKKRDYNDLQMKRKKGIKGFKIKRKKNVKNQNEWIRRERGKKE